MTRHCRTISGLDAYEAAARHARLHLVGDPERASFPDAIKLCGDGDNELFLSMVSLWEMQLKTQLGKLQFKLPLDELIEAQQRVNGVRLLPIEPQHIYALSQLPFHHKDPFDRLLIAQAITEGLPLISADPALSAYPAQIIW